MEVYLLVYVVGSCLAFRVMERRRKDMDDVDFAILSALSCLSWIAVLAIGLGAPRGSISGKRGDGDSGWHGTRDDAPVA